MDVRPLKCVLLMSLCPIKIYLLLTYHYCSQVFCNNYTILFIYFVVVYAASEGQKVFMYLKSHF